MVIVVERENIPRVGCHRGLFSFLLIFFVCLFVCGGQRAEYTRLCLFLPLLLLYTDDFSSPYIACFLVISGVSGPVWFGGWGDQR